MTVERKWNGTEWVITGGGGDVAVGAVGMRATVEIDSAPPISTTWTTVPTTRIEEDHGGAFSLAANGVMTCLVAGVYSISGGVFWARTTDADLRANLNLNGASIGKGLHSVSTNKYATLTMTATVSLNVGDQIWMSAWASPASSLMSNTTDYQGNYLEAFSVAGLKGDKGDKGDTGDKGDKGDPGLMGDLPTTRVSTTTWHITNNTADYMPFTTVERDDEGWVTGDEVIVQTTGVYLVSGTLRKAVTNALRVVLAVTVNGNGTDITTDQQWANRGIFRTRSVSGVLLLNAGDRVQLRTLIDSGADPADASGALSVTRLEGMQGPKGDTGDPGWKPRPVWRDVQTQHNINSTSANVSLNPPTSVSWTNQESYPMMVRYEGAGLCYMSGATDLMYLRPDVSGGTSLGIGVEWRVDFPDTEGGTYFPAFHVAAMAEVAAGATVTFEITGRSTSPMDGYIRYFRHQAWAVGPA